MSAVGKSAWLNWPNALTLSRVLIGVLCLAPLASPSPVWLALAFALMGAAELTDFLDGLVARATGAVTDAGKILDPMADSMYRLIIFAAFVQNDWMPAGMMAVFVIRDVGVAYCRIIAISKLMPVASRFSGKAKAVTQAAAQLFTVGVAAFQLDFFRPFVTPLLYMAAAVTAYSLIDYAAAMLAPQPKAP
jgi:CDP-diacylglycerol--glycerol-3-phosphate 3-phosphatidyltransferase